MSAQPLPEYAFFNHQVETMSADETVGLQLGKLANQLSYVVKNAAFYRDRFDQIGAEPGDIKSLEDLAKLPFVEKSDLRKSQQIAPPLGQHSAASMDDVVRVHASSGTTGTPSYVGLTAFDKQRWIECISRSFWAQGLRQESRFAMGMSIGFFVGGLPIANVVEEIGATLIPIGSGASDRLIDSIQTMNADFLLTTPSYALHLAETARRQMGIDPATLGIERVLVGAEPGGGVPQIRSKIEQDWNAKCMEAIGNADLITIHSAECEQQDGCHFVVPDYLIMEIIDPDSGEVLSLPASGAEIEGEMVFTHLDRQCNPMVRFRSRDIVRINTSKCACGRTGPRLKCIGRSDDMLNLRGVNVWPSAIKDVVMSFGQELSGEMLISLDAPPPKVTPPLNIKVELPPSTQATDELKQRVERKLRDKLIFTSAVDLVAYGSLPRTEMKAKLIDHAYLRKG